MALVPQLIGMQPRTASRTGQDVLVDVGTGIAIGVLINDVWEIFQLPGYYVDAFSIDKMNWGWDDVISTFVIPLAAALVGRYAHVTGAIPIAIGMWLGSGATKFVEAYFDPVRLQLIPHTALPPSSAMARGYQANPTENQLRAFQANPTQNQLRTPMMGGSVRFSS